jgi:hypothetical protein
VPAAGGWRGVPAALKSGGRRRSRPGQRNGEGPVRAKGLAEIGMGPGAVKAVTGGLEVLRGGRPWRARTARPARWLRRVGRRPGAWGRRGAGGGPRAAGRAGGRCAGGGRGGSGSTGISSNSAAAEGEEGEGELSGGGARRGQRRARGGDPWEEEPLPREREREGEGERRAGGGGAAGAAAGAPGGAGAAKATCPPNRSQAATDRLTCEPSVAPATSTPWRVRIAGSMKGPGGAPAGLSQLEPKWLEPKSSFWNLAMPNFMLRFFCRKRKS